MRIYCDMDDILCETAATLCRRVRQEFGVVVAYEEVSQFDLQKVFGLTDAQMRRFMTVAHDRECLLSYPQTPGAVDGLRKLVAAGHEVDIVTGRPASSHLATEAWLEAAGVGGLPVTYVDKYGRLFSTGVDDPEMVPMDEILKRRYDVVIDDSPMVLPFFKDQPSTRVLVFDRPWNASFELAPNMTRVGGWDAILLELLRG